MKRKRKAFFPLAIIIVAISIVLLFVVSGIISDTSVSEQKKTLEAALLRDVVHCYAVEGSYPESLEYIEENYGLTYDEDKFYVDYQPIASNIMPDITVIEIQEDE